jgi:hypothetical protein
VVRAGIARVIIELRITPAFKPEGGLRDAAAVQAQRQAIAKAQSDLITRLAGTKFSISHQYDGLPFMAMEVGSDALDRLEGSGDLVARVQADATRVPQR